MYCNKTAQAESQAKHIPRVVTPDARQREDAKTLRHQKMHLKFEYLVFVAVAASSS